MASDRIKLKELLISLPLLTDEKRMWMALGFYVEPTNKYQPVTMGARLYDAAGNNTILGTVMANNLRITAIEWWEDEKKKNPQGEPTSSVKTNDFDQLEIQRQA